ncbi:hypothetical protein F2Q69_00061323 [Brassica cretica]|uniref:Uncharacterized protein n=1 Tax=Brassica cretica TaxID=69181 RepID=A0A8S9REQ1_BRACR|nr:hypothetical protein F2Q69_00061323 [Brassica cretica]
MEYFRKVINSTEGRKEKRKPPLGGVYKDTEANSQRRLDLLFYSFNRTMFGLILERVQILAPTKSKDDPEKVGNYMDNKTQSAGQKREQPTKSSADATIALMAKPKKQYVTCSDA